MKVGQVWYEYDEVSDEHGFAFLVVKSQDELGRTAYGLVNLDTSEYTLVDVMEEDFDAHCKSLGLVQVFDELEEVFA